MRTVDTADADHVEFPNLGTTYLMRGEDTEGRFALLEHQIPARRLAAPMHVHANEDEYSLVLTGRVGIQVGEEVAEAGPGELVFKPRGVPHAFWNAGDEEARLLELISPGGFEPYFEEMAPVLSAEGEPDFEQVGAIQARYALKMDRESIGPLVERHGLEA
jgi:mannose-6-phosphate isomerase-like protein (cupin superfamily)